MTRSIYLPIVLIIISATIFAAGDSGQAPREKTPKAPKELLERRLEVARRVFQLKLEKLKNGEAVFDESVLSWSDRILAAQLAITDDPADQTKALTVHVERVRQVAKIATAFAKAGQGRELDAETAKYFLFDAEIQLSLATSE